MATASPPLVYLCAAQGDDKSVTELHNHLKWYEDRRRLRIQARTQLSAGTDAIESARKAIDEAQIAVLFLSVDFTNDHQLVNHELPRLNERARERRLIRAVIHVRACLSKEEVLQVPDYLELNVAEKPWSGLNDDKRERAIYWAAQEILKHLGIKPTQPLPVRCAGAVALVPLVLLGPRGEEGGWRADPPPGMVRIEGGVALHGSTASEITQARAACLATDPAGVNGLAPTLAREAPPQLVQLSPYYLDVTEVDTASFANFLNRRAARLRRDGDRVLEGDKMLARLDPHALGYDAGAQRYVAHPERKWHPMARVSWYGALRFCEERGARLPSEAQWERAARGLARRRYPWGDDEPSCAGVIHGQGSGQGCAGIGSAPVGTASQDRTAEGVRDLGGNVAEWVADAYVDPYPTCSPACADPMVQAPVPERAVRGGHFDGLALECRGAGRAREKANETLANLGFRCAQELP